MEIEEAAMIDGCSRLGALVRVVVPIIAPGMAVVALFAFIATWNEFLFAVVLTGIETKTMMVLVTTFTSGGTDMFYGEASASVVLGVLPAFAVAFMLQRYLVKGLALGGHQRDESMKEAWFLSTETSFAPARPLMAARSSVALVVALGRRSLRGGSRQGAGPTRAPPSGPW